MSDGAYTYAGADELRLSLIEANPFHEVTQAVVGKQHAIDGATWVNDEPDGVPAVWGDDDAVLWAEGEGLMLVGPDGVGKTTLAHQLIRARVGLATDVLGVPVAGAKDPVLYIAADRPRQAARAFRRTVSEDAHEILRERLIVWRGPLPFDIGLEKADPTALARFIKEAGAGTVFIDSLKDIALDLTKDEQARASTSRSSTSSPTASSSAPITTSARSSKAAGSRNGSPTCTGHAGSPPAWAASSCSGANPATSSSTWHTSSSRPNPSDHTRSSTTTSTAPAASTAPSTSSRQSRSPARQAQPRQTSPDSKPAPTYPTATQSNAHADASTNSSHAATYDGSMGLLEMPSATSRSKGPRDPRDPVRDPHHIDVTHHHATAQPCGHAPRHAPHAPGSDAASPL